MRQISSNVTLILKFFIPTFWVVFFGAFTIAVLASQNPYFEQIPAFIFKVGVCGFYLLGIWLIWYFLWSLKRVEADDSYLVVTDYFKTYKYKWEDVSRIQHFNFQLLQSIRVHLKAPGSFGKSISFIISKRRLAQYLAEHPSKETMFFGA